jgi:hypothetical protein
MNRVVKCKNNRCGQHYMHTEKNTKCPFCFAEYREKEEETKDKKGAIKNRKESFKVWKDN